MMRCWKKEVTALFLVVAFSALLFALPTPVSAAVDSVSPSQGNHGETLDVVIRGSPFTGATNVSFGSGIDVNSFEVNSITKITANITIHTDAIPGPRDVSVTTPGGTDTLVNGFTVPSRPPSQPSNILPANGATGVSVTPILESSAFSDPDTGDTHDASQWQVREATAPDDYSVTVFDSVDGSNLTQITLSPGTLDGNSTYYWRVRYRDSYGKWSAWSDETSFTTLNRPPNQPTNESPSDGAIDISVTPTLQSSAFSDPDSGDTHTASQWQVREATAPDDYSVVVFDSETDSSNLTEITLSPGTLTGHTTYYWRVRHQDNHDTWSDWAAETSFTTSSQAPDQPTNESPSNGATGISVTPTLESSAFSDPDSGDTHTASQWQIRTSWGNYLSPVFDSGIDAANLIQMTVPPETLDYNRTYYWRVSHQDNYDAWSDWSNETSFTTLNRAPAQPNNVTPDDEATDRSPTLPLTCSGFSDPDTGDTHGASQWQIREATAPDDYSVTVFDSDTDTVHLIQITIPSGNLDYNTTYYWRVRHQDNHDTWSDWSDETSFTTLNRAPDQPTNESPSNGAADISVTPTLESSAFSDPDSDGTHAASQWQIRVSWGGYASPVFDSGTDSTDLTEIILPPGTLDGNTTYYWRVRHQDNHDAWSSWSDETSFTTANRAPDQPANVSPPSGATGISVTPALQSSAFSDPDSDGTHTASQWQIREATAPDDYSVVVFDSETDSSNLTEIALSPGTLDGNTTYYWRVRHQDNHDTWSDWSDQTSFTTANRAPAQPANVSPPSGATGISVTPTLQSSAFSDPDSDGTHTASQWQIREATAPDDYSVVVFDSDTDDTNLTEIALSPGTLDGNTTYYWRVRHQDNHDGWSDWSNETSFTTLNRAPGQPTNVSPASGATGISVTSMLVSSAFSDPDSDGTHTASQWQIREATAPDDYSVVVFDSGTDSSNLTEITVASGTLDGNSTYYWRIRHQDNHGDWSDWSDQTSFTTANRAPDQPANVSPASGATGVSVTPALQSSDFSDPDSDGTHTASQWQIREATAPDDYSVVVFDSGTDSTDLIDTTVAPETLDYNTSYYWRVKHQDSHDDWSDWSDETFFTTLNRAPDQPVNVSPPNEDTDVSLTPVLQSSAFSDPDTDGAHAASRWQIREATAPDDYSAVVFDSGADPSNLTETTVSPGVLNGHTKYYWRVSYRDNYGAWSDWSDETPFTTRNRTPVQPANVSPADEDTDISVIPVLQSSAFLDPDTGDTHAASQWQITRTPFDYSISALVYDSEADDSSLTQFTVPSGNLDYNTTYYWRVKHQDDHDGWSDWSDETSFTTLNRAPDLPVNVSPGDKATAVSLRPTLQSSDFSDPDTGDTHTASQWQITTTSLDYSSPVFDISTTSPSLTQFTVPSGNLDYNTTYYWRVRHQDNHGDWSPWSDETSFTTLNRVPDPPVNVSPANGAVDISLTPALQSSAFSDPDTGDTHTASQWQITTTSLDYSSPVFDSGADASNVTSITIPSGTLSYDTTYYWVMRHQDNHGGWSNYSDETSFTTRNTPAGSQVAISLVGESLIVTFDSVSADGYTTATAYEELLPEWGPIPYDFRAVGGVFVDVSTTATYEGLVTQAWYYGEFESEITSEGGLKVFHWNGTRWEDVTVSVDTVDNIIYAQLSTLSPIFVANPWLEAETPAGSEVTVTPGDLIMTFQTVTASGITTVTRSGDNPVDQIPGNLSCVGRVFVGITTTATYSGPVTVGIGYSELDVLRKESDLSLFHWNGTKWEDVTVSVDTTNNVVYGEVPTLSPFFVAEVVTVPVTTSPGVYVGIAAFFVFGILVFFVARRVVGHERREPR